MDGEWEAPLIENPQCTNAPGCGKWNAPLITNPNYKGVWRAPLIVNPQYQGKWAPKKIANPDYFKDDNPFKMTTIVAVGIELWSMSPSLLFDNIIITDDLEAAESWAQQTFHLKVNKLDKDSDSVWSWLVKTTDANPWLWGVYVLIIALLTGFVIYMCCVPSQEKEELEKEANAKKTDAEVEDQPLIEEEESGHENEEVSQGEEEYEESNTKDDQEENNSENQNQSESSGELETTEEQPRKRKSRKE